MAALTNTDEDAPAVTGSFKNERIKSTLIFTITSVLLIGLIGVALGAIITRTVQYHVLETYMLSTITQVGAVVTAHVDEDDFKTPFSGTRYDEFNAHVHEAMNGSNVEQVNLWSPSRTLLFSTMKDDIGITVEEDTLWSRLDSGQATVFELVEPDTEMAGMTRSTSGEIGDEHGHDDAGGEHAAQSDDDVEHATQVDDHEGDGHGARRLRILYPVVLSGSDSGRLDGVYEVVISTVALDHHMQLITRTLVMGLGALVALLIGVSQLALVLLRRRNDRLEQLTLLLGRKANTDGLTGLHNHKHFQNFLESQTTIAGRYEKNLGLIMLDLDFFKTVNDRFGHQIGDKVLKKVAGVFAEVLRDADYAARYGGEEFVVVLPETDVAGAMRVAERLREATEALQIDVEGSAERPKVTVSCGVADFPGCADNRESLIAAADSALLFAKKRGRNRVCFFRDISGADFEEGDMEKLISRLQHASMPTIQALVAVVDKKDAYDRGRSRNLAQLASKFGAELDMPEHIQHALKMAAQVHDIGKAVVPGRILGKTEELTETEMEAIRAHPEAGAKIVETAAQTENLLAAVLHHHENWDGTGYPDKLKGSEIPYLARVLRVLDAYEAMISDRPYREALSHEAAIAELQKKAGTEFDPELIGSFTACLDGLLTK